MPPRSRKPALTAAEAEIVAIRALAHLASREAALARFMALTGVAPQDLRARAGDADFLASVLDYVLADEPLLVDMAACLELAPEELARAGALLLGWRPQERAPLTGRTAAAARRARSARPGSRSRRSRAGGRG